MTIKACLLVSDDPDDHFQFAEALQEISPAIVLLTVLNTQKALDIVRSKRFVPDYIFLDLTMMTEGYHEFFTASEDGKQMPKVKLIPYGDSSDGIAKEKFIRTAFIDKDFSYTELKDFLKRVIDN
jgi:DNA-binding NtrC family response regulator